MNNIILSIYFIGFVLSSSDIFLTINIGANLRPSLIFFGINILVVLSKIIANNKIIVPIGFSYLLSWTLIIVAFVPNTNLISRSLVWAIVLIINVLIVLAIVNSFDHKGFINLVKYYIYSFVIIAIFAVIQLITPLIKLPPILVTQWIFPGILPRINGLSYEPSYFATYMLLGWSFICYLVRIRSSLLPMRKLKIIFYLLSFTLLLSTSKLAWACILIWYLQYPVIFFKNLIIGKTKIILVILISIFLSIVLTIVFIVVNYLTIDLTRFSDLNIFLSGTGLAGTPNHSVSIRSENFYDTLKVFYKSPLIGYSLGGIAPAIGKLYGVNVVSNEIAQNYEGMNVFAEVLAASGVLGVIPFVLYFIIIFSSSIKYSKKYSELENTPNTEVIQEILIGLSISLIVELFALNFCQTITRIYLWVHIAMLSAAIKNSKLTAFSGFKHLKN